MTRLSFYQVLFSNRNLNMKTWKIDISCVLVELSFGTYVRERINEGTHTYVLRTRTLYQQTYSKQNITALPLNPEREREREWILNRQINRETSKYPTHHFETEINEYPLKINAKSSFKMALKLEKLLADGIQMATSYTDLHINSERKVTAIKHMIASYLQ